MMKMMQMMEKMEPMMEACMEMMKKAGAPETAPNTQGG